jgi:hypothetical protein
LGRYINWDDVVGRYSQINKHGGAADIGSNFIQYAEAEVDARLASCYSVPFVSGVGSTPITVKDLAIDVTYLKATIGAKSKAWDQIKNSVNDRIKMICNGDSQIVGPGGDPLAQIAGTIWGSNEDYHPIFGMGDTLDFVVDSDRIDDEDDARG